MQISKQNLDFIRRVLEYFFANWIGYIWFALTLIFALMIPFVMRIVTSSQYTFINFISDGDIVLFSMVIIASLMIDNFMFEEDFAIFLNNNKNAPEHLMLVKRFMVFIFPLLMVMFCLIAYMGCIKMRQDAEIDAFVVAIELVTFFAIAGYAAHIKQLSWNNKKISSTTSNKVISSH